MRTEAVDMLACRPGQTVVDGTLGGCGHARLIHGRITPGGVLIGIDQDQDAIDHAHRVFPEQGAAVHVVHGNFVDLSQFLSQLGIDAVDGILVDIGLSQHQIEASGRGFSFSRDEPLDMRMDVRRELTAADLIADLSEKDMARLFSRYGEERWAARIARYLVEQRRMRAITTSGQLAGMVARAVPAAARHKQAIHPATRVFMALRIAVNKELDVLDRFLPTAVDHLKPGGRLCVLSFHSLEDRIVKHRFREMHDPCTCPPAFPHCVCGRKPMVRLLTRKVVRPSSAEVNDNPMARSTRLRAVEKL
ncbi:MAG: 16S rRNA (cytosine(1402)-N(4))-methyltransferase [Proteobacteria bacterium]|nr:MAG: 16S rRNA (cytosine(1402)-N(4))-methyltransferase [Pseudomonadota bacterium]